MAAQHDYDLANQAGAAFRADLNLCLAAIVGLNWGPTAPATTFAYMFWADTTTGILKQRNAANSGWIDKGLLASLTFSPANADVVLAPTGTGKVTIGGAAAGTLDNAVIGGTTPLAGTFTSLSGTAIATQANQETGTSTTTVVSPGRQQYHPSACKGWIIADAAGTSAGSYNVTSITDTGAGDLLVTWNVDFSGSVNYNIQVSIETNAALACRVKSAGQAAGTTAVQAFTVDTPALTDPTNYHVAVFGDQ